VRIGHMRGRRVRSRRVRGRRGRRSHMCAPPGRPPRQPCQP
jgi:hypothetical protein